MRGRHLACHEAFALSLGMIRVTSAPGRLHPMALDPVWVRL
jgi:hypothetical protein